MEHAASPQPGSAPGPEAAAQRTQRGEEPPDGGDQELYIAFYREYVPHLVAFLVWQGANLLDAADLAQETMIDAYRSWGEIEFPRAWAKRVASRKYARRLTAQDALLSLEIATPLLSSGLNVAEWEEHHDVLRKLAELPLRQRQVMAWTYDGYTEAEIAGELRMSVDAVRHSLMRARHALAAKLSGPGGDG